MTEFVPELGIEYTLAERETQWLANTPGEGSQTRKGLECEDPADARVLRCVDGAQASMRSIKDAATSDRTAYQRSTITRAQAMWQVRAL
jgi:hypothetical protein